ncbi:hypothetical protein [Deinococcus apachensis]|uniref:hypothetical protein n=1 Tax=Deinococcus apachensis TaxID=309886 RepID=UPI000378875C|nr:hypothetical protein [Deinococcus apachensis]
MHDPDEKDLPSEVDAKDEARSFMSARHHVGAAGFAQSNVLEQIITAGREQIELIRSLRQVVDATHAQLQALPPADRADATQPQVATLQNIVREGQAQIEAAEELRRAIQRTLADIRGTPVEEVSAKVLKTLGEIVWQQAADLENLITAAITEASTTEQITNLERVSEETQTRLEHVEHEQVERELVHLHLLGHQALEHIRSLEASGQTHAEQRAQLEQEAEVARRSIAALEVTQAQNTEELVHLRRQREVSKERIAALEAGIEITGAQLEASNHDATSGELNH